MEADTIQWARVIADLTILVAAHGVFAFSIICIFWLWRRSANNVKDSQNNPQMFQHFSKVHSKVVWLTVTLVLAASVIWGYVNFAQLSTITGVVSGFDVNRHQLISRRVADRNYYHGSMYQDGKYWYKWALVVRGQRPTSIEFVLQYQPATAARPPRQTTGMDLEAVGLSSLPDSAPVVLEKHFDLILPLGAEKGMDLEWVAKPGNGLDGELFLVTQMGNESIPLRDRSQRSTANMANPKNVGWFSLSTVAYAQSENSLSTAALISLLASPNLQDQLEGRDRIIAGWPATRAVFRETLENLKSSLDRPASARVVHNLVEIANEVEATNHSLEANDHLSLGLLLLSSGSYERTAEYLSDKPDIRDPLRHAYIGMAYHSLNSYEPAAQAYEAYIEQSAGQPSIWNNLGLSYLGLDRGDDAETSFRKALALRPGYSLAINNLAYLYAEEFADSPGKLAEGLRLVGQVLSSAPHDARFLDTKGWLLHKSGRSREALPVLEEALQYDPQNDTLRDHIAEVRARLRSPN